MKRLIDVLKAAMMMAAIVLLAKAFFVLDHVQKSIVSVRGDVHEITGSINAASTKLNTTLDDVRATEAKVNTALDDTHALLRESAATVKSINAVVEQDKPKIGLVLDHTNRFLIEAENTGMEVRKAAAEQRSYWSDSGKQQVLFFGKLNTLTDNINANSVKLSKALDDFDAVIGNPAIPSTLNHVDKILADGEKVADRFAKPVNTAKAIGTWTLDRALHFFGFR